MTAAHDVAGASALYVAIDGKPAGQFVMTLEQPSLAPMLPQFIALTFVLLFGGVGVALFLARSLAHRVIRPVQVLSQAMHEAAHRDVERIIAQAVAEATRDAMWKDDRASRGLGMQVVAVGPGSATLTMAVREDMLNGHDICHGGFMTLLADSAFAFACNAYNEVTVASGFDVNLLASGRLGDVLTARATEVVTAGPRRRGLYLRWCF